MCRRKRTQQGLTRRGMIDMAILGGVRRHIILTGFLIASVVASGTALLFTRSESRSESRSQSDQLVPLAARVDKIDGTVGIDRQFADQGVVEADQQGNQALTGADWKAPIPTRSWTFYLSPSAELSWLCEKGRRYSMSGRWLLGSCAKSARHMAPLTLTGRGSTRWV